jgi:hypothetical protein
MSKAAARAAETAGCECLTLGFTVASMTEAACAEKEFVQRRATSPASRLAEGDGRE